MDDDENGEDIPDWVYVILVIIIMIIVSLGAASLSVRLAIN